MRTRCNKNRVQGAVQSLQATAFLTWGREGAVSAAGVNQNTEYYAVAPAASKLLLDDQLPNTNRSFCLSVLSTACRVLIKIDGYQDISLGH